MRCSLTLLLLWIASVPQAVGAPVDEAQVFGALPELSDVVLNPAGTLLAWRDGTGAEPRLVVFDIGAHKISRTVRIDTDVRLRSLAWADNDTILMTMSFPLNTADMADIHRFEFYRTLACDVSTGQTRRLLIDSGYHLWAPVTNLISWHTAKPHTVVMGAFAVFASAFGWKYSLFEVDTHSGKVGVLEGGHAIDDDWAVDRDGAAVARSEWQPGNHTYAIYGKGSSGWREILHQQRPEGMALVEISPDRDNVLAIGGDAKGRARLWAVPLNGSGAKDILPDVTEDVVDVVRDPLTGAPVAARLGGLQQMTRWLDPQADKQHQTVAKAFPGREVRIAGRSESNARVVAEVQGPSSPPIYYLVDFNTHQADIVGEAYPALTGKTLGEVRAITYKARDGSTIPAYLTLPRDAKEKNLPLIVLPHSGPDERDSQDFNWWAQFLAARGYLVLQPQFRGSTGFGEAFRRAGLRQWGGLMQDDVTDGVRALVDQGLANAGRVCIVGAGRYAGYAALAGAAFTPDTYACVVSINGVSNLPEMLQYMRDHDGQDSNYLKDQIGAASDPHVIDKSPVQSAARVRAPLLLLYAARDTVVPPGQSEQMANALRQAGASVTLVRLEGEDHWLTHTNTRVQMLREIDTFLNANLH